MAQHLTDGNLAEQMALLYLQRHGLKLLEKNWSCKYGEIDLIMQDGKSLVFVEVKYRKQQKWGNAIETITPHKRQKIITTATFFLQKHHQLATYPCRFDVVSLMDDLNNPTIEWLTDAFSAS